MNDTAKSFAESFKNGAGDITAATFSGSIRFIAIMLAIIAVIWCINHCMTVDAKAQDSFLITLGSRLTRIILGLSLFILILIVKGN